jgi:type IV secretion system protein TrbJ
MKVITTIAILASLPLLSPATGIPVVDVAAIGQAIKQGLTQVQQYANEVAQYQLMLEQYKNQLVQATGIGTAAQIWQQAQGTLYQLNGVVNMFRSGAGVQGYLDNARDVNYWLASAPTSQTAAQSQTYWSGSQRTANQQMVQEIQEQERQITADSQTLQRLQAQAGGVAGTNQALEVGNEMAALQQKQLMEIRTLLVSEQQALAANSGAASTREAMQDAYSKEMVTSPYTFSDHQGWKP